MLVHCLQLLERVPLFNQINVEHLLFLLSRLGSIEVVLADDAIEIGTALDVGKLLELMDVQLFKQIAAFVIFRSFS